MTLRRFHLPPRPPLDDTGIQPLQPLDEAAWIWHPGGRGAPPAFVRFRCAFTATREELVLHLTADQNYAFRVDGHLLARGPDRGDVAHWSYASYRGRLTPGRHLLEVVAWNAGGRAPLGHMSWRPGFVLRAEGRYDRALSTGRGRWRVQHLRGWQMDGQDTDFGVSQDFHLDYLARDGAEGAWVTPRVVKPPVRGNRYGLQAEGWQLRPSQLPDQGAWPWRRLRVRAAGSGPWEEGRRFDRTETTAAAGAGWARWLKSGRPLRLPLGFDGFVLLDLGSYACLYPELVVSGGARSRIRLQWAESLYDQPGRKGNRDQVTGKFLDGPSDWFTTDGGRRRFERPWFRAGRYLLLHIRTAEQPLTLQSFSLTEVRYPLRVTGRFRSSDRALAPVQKLCRRGIEASMHSCFLDSPYYEQMMYVGDLRVQLLTLYTLGEGAPFARRCIELFDHSRRHWGIVQERYPSRTPQLSPTYALLWILILRDYAWWQRAEPAWLAARLTGVRSQLACFEAWRNREGLLSGLPGWCFVDWVEGWAQGTPPEGRGGTCALANLHYLLALEAAADLETWHGDAALATLARARAAALRIALRRTFRDAKSNLLADRPGGRAESEHAQVLGLLGGLFRAREIPGALRVLESDHRLHRCSFYFSHYLFDVFGRHGRMAAFAHHLERWQVMVRQGLRTPLEAPEPARSDCHGWGSHPLHHLAAHVAGIQPSAPGFQAVRIAPAASGPWTSFTCTVPHPDGRVNLEFTPARGRAVVSLPPGLRGTFEWAGRTRPLRPGRQVVPLR